MTPLREMASSLKTYQRIHIPWDEPNGGVNAYLANDLTIAGGLVRFTADGWLWSSEPGESNEIEYFDEPQPMAIPVARITEIYWPTELAESHWQDGPPE